MKYERFWDLHVTANNGYYDFANKVQTQVDYQLGQQADVTGTFRNLVSPATTAAVVEAMPMNAQNLPRTGVVASMAKIKALDKADGNGASGKPDARALVQWVSNPAYKGKIRLNAHGLEGKIVMAQGPGGTVDQIHAFKFALWLVDNGLDSLQGNDSRVSATPTGLLTIALAICFGTAQSADGSSQQQVANALKIKGHLGIKVTAVPWVADTVSTLANYVPNWLKANPDAFTAFNQYSREELAGHAEEFGKRLPPEGFDYLLAKFGLFRQGFDGAPFSWQLLRMSIDQLRVFFAHQQAVFNYFHFYQGLKPGQWVTHMPQRQGLMRPPVGPPKWVKAGAAHASKATLTT
jgi:hypothetical protein